MDTRSSPDEVPFGGWRFVQNMEVRQRKKLHRSSGWTRHLDSSAYNNEDLHDQLLLISPPGAVREPITFLYEASSRGGFSRLLAGTPRRLYALNNSTGNWKLLSDAYGETLNGTCADFGWGAGQVNDTVVLSNGVDPILYWNFDAPADEDTGQSIKPIPDLDKIGVSSAKVVVAFKGIVFLMNVVQEGIRHPMRVISSDINRPISWTPNEGISAAVQADISATGESILGAAPIADSIFIYTNLSIYEMFLTGDTTTIFGFRRRYHSPTGNSCLAYRRTLVSTGADHFYFGRDGIYHFSLYLPQPERIELVHHATKIIFEDINSQECHPHVGGYDDLKKTLYFSWATAGSDCPDRTLAWNTEYGFVSHIDHGFTAFLNSNPDSPTSIREWLVDNCICSPDELDALGFGTEREGQACRCSGGNCVSDPPPTCSSYPTSIFSSNTITVDGVEIEDYNQAEPSPGSLCEKLATLDIEKLCDTELTSDECHAEQFFIAASSTDWCLKSFAEVYYRDRCIAFDQCATYVRDGYTSLLRSGALDFKDPQNAKNLSHIEIEAFAEETTDPVNLNLRVGAAFQAGDPNLDRCPIVWFNQQPRKLKCVSEFNGQQHIVNHTRPAMNVEWQVFIENCYLYFEFSIHGTGGASNFSRVGLKVRKKNRY